MVKSISYSDLRTYLKCKKQFDHRRIHGWQPPTAKEAVANALHAIAEHGGDMRAAARKVQRQLDLIESEEERELARLELASRAPAVAEMVRSEPPGIREKVYRWFDAVSGWWLCAKPDRVRWFDEGNARIMEITDYKDTLEITGAHRKQLFFFAMVMSKAINHLDPIRMVVKRFKSHDNPGSIVPPVQTFRYSHYRTESELTMWRGHLAEIDRLIEAGNFPAQAGWYCKDCALYASCDQRKEYERHAGSLALPTVRSLALPVLVDGPVLQLPAPVAGGLIVGGENTSVALS